MSRAPACAAGRGGSQRRGAPKVRVTTPQRRRPATVGQKVGAAIARLPLPPDFFRRLRNWALGLFVAAGVLAGIVAMGVPQMIGLSIAHGLGAAGFTVRNIQIQGRTHVDAPAVYAIVADARGQDMPLVDLEVLRRQLLALGWVADARVSRRLPDTLVVDLVERVPAAILQRNGQLSLVDADGHVLDGVDARRLPMQLPLVIGWGVERHLAGLKALVATQPALARVVTGGTWVGDRRWDLRFQSGEVLALPEGEAAAQKALALFARKDQAERLLGRGYVHFDMRLPGQLVVRTSREPGARIEDPAPPPAAGALPPNSA
jgi:cell division protein FtsQ